MKKSLLFALSLIFVSSIMLIGCKKSETRNSNVLTQTDFPKHSASAQKQTKETSKDETKTQAAELVVNFGDQGDPFIMHLYDNDTAAAILNHVGSSDWRLPIYHYDDYDNWEVMQYYDIPSHYEIPSAPEQITEEKAGTVYYSDPNRIILFYQDAEVSAEYTPVGYFDYSEEFLEAVKNNPVLKGWENKIVLISDGK